MYLEVERLSLRGFDQVELSCPGALLGRPFRSIMLVRGYEENSRSYGIYFRAEIEGYGIITKG